MTPTTGQLGFAQLSGGNRFLAGKVTGLRHNQTCRAGARRERWLSPTPGAQRVAAPQKTSGICLTEQCGICLTEQFGAELSERFWETASVYARQPSNGYASRDCVEI